MVSQPKKRSYEDWISEGVIRILGRRVDSARVVIGFSKHGSESATQRSKDRNIEDRNIEDRNIEDRNIEDRNIEGGKRNGGHGWLTLRAIRW